MKSAPYGTSDFTSKGEILDNKDFLCTRSLFDYNGLLLGEKRGLMIGIKVQAGNNHNSLLVGTSGGGKTSAFILPNIIARINSGDSFVCIDPKSELFQKNFERLRENNYKILIFNLKEPKLSDGFDLLENIPLSSEAINELCESIFDNLSVDPLRDNQFFKSGAKNILSFLIATSLELKRLDLEGKLSEGERVSGNGHKVGTIGYALDLIYETQADETVVKRLKNLHEFLAAQFPKSIVHNYWNTFNPGSDLSLLNNYLGNFREIITSFTDNDIKKIFSTNDFNVKDVIKEKTALFLIMNENTNSPKNKLCSILIQNLMQTVEKLKDQDIYRNKYKQYCWFILDEFGAIGTISGFDSIISGCRSRDMAIIMAVQSIAQLKTNYPSSYNTIISNVEVQIAGRLKDDESIKFFSARSGETTVEAISEVIAENNEKKLNKHPVKRNLMLEGELLGLDKKFFVIYQDLKILVDQVRDYEHEALKSVNTITIEEYYKLKRKEQLFKRQNEYLLRLEGE